jgi:hypothetical protein
MAGTRLRKETLPENQPFDAQVVMRELTRDFEAIRGKLRASQDFDERELEDMLDDLINSACTFKAGLRRRRKLQDQMMQHRQQRSAGGTSFNDMINDFVSIHSKEGK